MAIDKAVDSSVLEAGLTTIANAIREKGGTSDTLAFPDAMAEAIKAIGAGGGFGALADILDLSEADAGSFVPTGNTVEYDINTNLTKLPKIMLIFREPDDGIEYSGKTFLFAIQIVSQPEALTISGWNENATRFGKFISAGAVGGTAISDFTNSVAQLSCTVGSMVNGDGTYIPLGSHESKVAICPIDSVIGGIQLKPYQQYISGASYYLKFLAGYTYRWFALA